MLARAGQHLHCCAQCHFVGSGAIILVHFVVEQPGPQIQHVISCLPSAHRDFGRRQVAIMALERALRESYSQSDIHGDSSSGTCTQLVFSTGNAAR